MWIRNITPTFLCGIIVYIMDQSPIPIVTMNSTPNPASKKSLLFIVIGFFALAVIGGGFWYWSRTKTEVSPSESAERQEQKPQEPEKLQENVGGGLGASIYEKSQNPIVDKLPETNPFGKAPINPLKSVYTNPFE
jgi:hypothetical protein